MDQAPPAPMKRTSDANIAVRRQALDALNRGDAYRTAEIYHIRDGKVTARWAFSDDTAAINEFFAGS